MYQFFRNEVREGRVLMRALKDSHPFRNCLSSVGELQEAPQPNLTCTPKSCAMSLATPRSFAQASSNGSQTSPNYFRNWLKSSCYDDWPWERIQSFTFEQV